MLIMIKEIMLFPVAKSAYCVDFVVSKSYTRMLILYCINTKNVKDMNESCVECRSNNIFSSSTISIV